KPSGSARRRLILDAKSRIKPKSAERFFWTKGVSEFIRVDAAYVATTDSRPLVRAMARRMGLLILDGKDLSRIGANEKTTSTNRLSGEEFDQLVRKADTDRYSREWLIRYTDAKASLVEEFGAASANRALTAFSFFSAQALSAPPGSETATTAVRLALFTASIL